MADKRKRYTQREDGSKKEYQRLVKNAKAKLSRIEDNISKSWASRIEAQLNIPSYDEVSKSGNFEEFAEKMTSFTDRNNKEYQFHKNSNDMPYSQAELERGLELREVAKERAENFIDKYEDLQYHYSGKEAGYTVGDRMSLYKEKNVAGIKVPKEFNINSFQNRDRLEGRLELLQEKAEGAFFDRSMRQMQENFMRALKGSFNSEADDIVNMIDSMPEDDFFEVFLMNAEFTFEDYASDGSIDGTAEQADLLRGYLQEYYRGNVDMDLKGYYLTDKPKLAPNSKFVRDVRKRQGRE